MLCFEIDVFLMYMFVFFKVVFFFILTIDTFENKFTFQMVHLFLHSRIIIISKRGHPNLIFSQSYKVRDEDRGVSVMYNFYH